MLKLQCFGAKIIMVSLQPRNYGWLSRMFVRILSPDMVFVQNEASMKRLVRLGCHVALLPSGVDLNKFTPVVSNDKKTEIRRKYGLDTQAFTMLHVGHITRDRNIEMLLRLKYEYKAQVILVSSSLRHKDRDMLKNLLQENGIVVIDEYLHEIQEIYQLADCYVFPVFSSSACIGVPLSVLEAMACNLSVVSVRYGNLPLIFQEGNGLIYADSPRDLIDAVSHAQNINGQCRTREKVAPYSWQKIARYVIEQIKMEK
jgi:glycosyltransferase involved in cell wall biosynthesis